MWTCHAERIAGLTEELGIGRADFVCNSWGGSVGLRLAALRPDLVSRLVVTGSVPVLQTRPDVLGDGAERGRAARNAFYEGDGPTLERMRTLISQYEWSDASLVPDSLVKLRYAQSLDPAEMAVAARSDTARGLREDLVDRLPEIEAPVLFFWGLDDAFVPPEYALALARMTPRGQMHALDRAGHHPQEERPRAYAAMVRAFLAAV
jgi:pimeloyl-ACP methyl ester carboxylesterase